jgi:hypothetical protein
MDLFFKVSSKRFILPFLTSYKIDDIFVLNCRRRLKKNKECRTVTFHLYIIGIALIIIGLAFEITYDAWIRYIGIIL